MTDQNSLYHILQRLASAKDKVRQEFSNISSKQLNWKPSPESWSIAQCLDHLLIADSCYFPVLEKIIAGTYQMSFWEKYSPFTHKCGELLKHRLQEQAVKKMKAPKKIQPKTVEKDISFIETYFNNLDRFMKYIEGCRQIDIDKTIITSPTISIVTYNLRDAFSFLAAHEHRHINQAIRVKEMNGFPES